MAKKVEGGGTRAARVGERIRAELMDLFLRGEVRHPDANGVLVSSVAVSDDLRHARVYVRVMDGERIDAVRQEKVVKALDRATPFLRGALGKRVGLKYTPELAFYWDEGVDHALRIESLLEEIKREGKG